MTDVTPGLAPDEKVCPYCAETIKAAAIRCRFCHSDLTVTGVPGVTGGGPAATGSTGATTGVDLGKKERADAVEPAAVIAPVEVTPAEDVPVPATHDHSAYADDHEGDAGLDGSRPGLLGAPLIAALLVLCLALGGALWYVVHRADHPHLDTAPNGQVTSSSFRNAAMSAASDAATAILSYSYKTFAADRTKAHALLGPALTKQYDQAMDQVAAQTASAKLTLKANVLAAGLLSAEEHKAKVLLFVNTVTTREGSKKEQLDQNRVVMELTRKDGDWTVSKMDAF